MLDDGAKSDVEAAARDYCIALHEADAERLRAVFHEGSHLYSARNGGLIDWPRERFVERVSERGPMAGAPEHEIESVAFAGPDSAMVALTVRSGPRLFRDHLNFLKLEGEWRVIAKIFHLLDGPEL